VVAVAADRDASLDRDAILMRLTDGLRLSLSAMHRQTTLARAGEHLYGVIPVTSSRTPGRPDPDVRSFVEAFAARHARTLNTPVRFGLGAVVPTVRDLPASRGQADRVLRVLQRRRGSGVVVADVVEVGDEALLDLVFDAMDVDPGLGGAAFGRVLDHDEARNSQFAETLLAWVDAFGDTDVAAEALIVHPNTVRYRVRQLRSLGLVDLDDPRQRLALQLHLRRWERLRDAERAALSET
jgi:DNA-binding PucR family transcriptional regulator